MFVRQSFARLYSSFGQQRKLFLLVFLWTCLCLVIFKSTLFNSSSPQQQEDALSRLQSPGGASPVAFKLHARAAATLAASSSPHLAAELLLSDQGSNGNVNALFYSISAPSSSSLAPAAAAAAVRELNVGSSSSAVSDMRGQPPRPSASNKSPKQQQAPLATSPAKQHLTTSHHSSSSSSGKHNNEFIAGSQCNYDYPSLFDLQFNNVHWQRMTNKASSGSGKSKPALPARPTNSTSSTAATPDALDGKPANFYLYNAYYDDRWRGGLPSVRVLAMIDRVQPPPTNCLFWSTKLRQTSTGDDFADGGSTRANQQQNSASSGGRAGHMVPLVTRATFVYAWYPKWGNYKDGLLQPWIITCPMPRSHVGLVPDSVSLVEVPPVITRGLQLGDILNYDEHQQRAKRDAASSLVDSSQQPASIAMPPWFSSSSPSVAGASSSPNSASPATSGSQSHEAFTKPMTSSLEYDCKQTLPITNNLPVYNQRPAVKERFAVCVKGLDFPHEDVSVRLIEWIELLNLLGAGKIFLYNLDVHENISKVLHYYQKRGIVELSPLTLPGDQPNLPEYQHLYLKSKLTAKRQNELIPYNDCLYRNLNSYQYLALLDIDEIIMPLERHNNWYDLMKEVETLSLSEQNYSRASYNVRNVYFFDDLQGPLGTTSSSSSSSEAPDSDLMPPNGDDEGADNSQQQQQEQQVDSLERGIPHYLHMMQHVYRSKNYTKPGQYVKCFHNTERVVSLHNHFPMNCFGQCTTYSIPVHLAHLQHYRKDCVGPLKQSCKSDFRVFTTRDTTIWKYKQRMIKRTTRVLNHLGLLAPAPSTRAS